MPIKMEDRTVVTKKQDEYLQHLATGPMTTNDLMREVMVSMATAAKIIKKLRDQELITSSKVPGAKGKVLLHTLVKPYSDLNIVIHNGNGDPLLNEEIIYVAILRNAGMTGQRLTDQFIKVFPHRTKKTIIKNILIKARSAKLCR